MVRLIDADALDQAMYHKAFEVYDGRTMWNSGCWIRYKIYEEASREAPTVDAEPVKHGKWESSRPDAPRPGFYYCSLCGRKRTSPQDRYCPNCGAKIDSEEEE